jgi:hypothetical protein
MMGMKCMLELRKVVVLKDSVITLLGIDFYFIFYVEIS